MKRLLCFLLAMISWVGVRADEPEKASPTYGVEIERELLGADIEGTAYIGATIRMKPIKANYITSNIDKVKVTIFDADGKKIWKKTLKNANLYIFSSGQIQIGSKNFDQIVVYKYYDSGKWAATIREKSGVY